MGQVYARPSQPKQDPLVGDPPACADSDRPACRQTPTTKTHPALGTPADARRQRLSPEGEWNKRQPGAAF